jgi:hypothetical protein
LAADNSLEFCHPPLLVFLNKLGLNKLGDHRCGASAQTGQISWLSHAIEAVILAADPKRRADPNPGALGPPAGYA